MNRIYLDNAATTPISEEVIEVMTAFMRDHYGNPSSIHAQGRTVRAAIENARKTIARYLNASIGEIFFTSGGTESNNMALKCAVRDLGVKRFISSPIEHHCVLHTLDTLKNSEDIEIDWVKLDQYGKVDLEHLECLLKESDSTTMVSLMHANNEIGTLIDLDEISQVCSKYGALFHSDTVQTIGHYPFDLNKTKINFLCGSAHKFHGPKGIGFIYINQSNVIKPYIDGGSQERNMRGGTENVYGIIGMAKAFELANEQLAERREKIEAVRKIMIEKIQLHFDDVTFNGDYAGDCLYTVLNVSFPPSPRSELLLLNLDIAGISASGGSACSSGAEGGSHVLTALGSPQERKNIRFSFSHYNTTQEIDEVIEKMKTFIPTKASV